MNDVVGLEALLQEVLHIVYCQNITTTTTSHSLVSECISKALLDICKICHVALRLNE